MSNVRDFINKLAAYNNTTLKMVKIGLADYEDVCKELKLRKYAGEHSVDLNHDHIMIGKVKVIA